MALKSIQPRKKRQPARARQIERSIRRSVVARNAAPEPVSGVFKARFDSLGTVLVCGGCARQFAGAPVPDTRFDYRALECFVCGAVIANLKVAA